MDTDEDNPSSNLQLPTDQLQLPSSFSSICQHQTPPDSDYNPYLPHLTHFKYQDYIQLPQSIRDSNDLVDEFIVPNTKMPDSEHSNIVQFLINRIIREHVRTGGRNLYIYSETDLYIPSRKESLRALEQAPVLQEQYPSPNKSTSSSHSGGRGNRRPDISVYDVEPEEQQDGSLQGRPPKMIIEITSDKNSRNNDLDGKWRAYNRTGCPEYVIVDRDQSHKGSSSHRPCIIVGNKSATWKKFGTGHPAVSEQLVTRSSTRSSKETYPRMIYDIDNVSTLHCSFLNMMTAKDILEPPSLIDLHLQEQRDIEEEMEKIRQDANDRVEKANDRAEKANDRAEKANDRVKKVEKECQDANDRVKKAYQDVDNRIEKARQEEREKMRQQEEEKRSKDSKIVTRRTHREKDIRPESGQEEETHHNMIRNTVKNKSKRKLMKNRKQNNDEERATSKETQVEESQNGSENGRSPRSKRSRNFIR